MSCLFTPLPISITFTPQTHQFDALLAAERSGIVSLVPLPERGGVDLHNAGLHQGLGAHQLIVGGVVDHVDDTRFASHT